MDHDLSPPWTSLNIAQALNFGLFIQPPGQFTIEKSIAFHMVTNGITFQEQSWVPSTPEGGQMVFLPTARAGNHLVPTIIEEYKLYFNLHIISLMFT